MSEMIERVARELERIANKGATLPPWSVMARAAIEAMRKPTKEMLYAPTATVMLAGVAFDADGEEHNVYIDRETAGETWGAMIDAALK